MLYGEKRRVIYFNLDHPVQRQMWNYSKSIQLGREVKQFLAMRMRGITLEQMVANGAQTSDTLVVDTSRFAGGE
ncbi:hypothetical protein JZ785_27475 (plasmid) [Alicyclobacillus curvatus]|nr:hypothetical protein JZ785_27475 [Alicyclobacillus curvatus]